MNRKRSLKIIGIIKNTFSKKNKINYSFFLLRAKFSFGSPLHQGGLSKRDIRLDWLSESVFYLHWSAKRLPAGTCPSSAVGV